MHRRLCQNNDKAEHKGGDKKQSGVSVRERAAELVADGHKANVHRREEDHKPRIGKEHAYEDLRNALLRQVQEDEVDDKEEANNKAEREENRARHRPKRFKHRTQKVLCNGVGGGVDGVLNVPRCENGKHKHRKDRTDRAKGDQTEAVFARIFTADGGSDAHAERHDKGNGDRTRRDTARIKAHRKHRLLTRRDHNSGNGKEGHIKEHQH